MQIKTVITMRTENINPLWFLRTRLEKSFILKRLDSNASCIKNEDGSYEIILRYNQPIGQNELRSIWKLFKDLKKLSHDNFFTQV